MLTEIPVSRAVTLKILIFFNRDIYHGRKWGSVGEWLGQSLAVLGVDGSSLTTASQRCDGLNSPYA